MASIRRASALAARDVTAGLTVIGNVVDAGHDMRSFGRRVLELLRLLMLVRAGADPIESNDAIRELATGFELAQLLHINRQFADVDFKIRSGSFPQLPLELAFVGSLIEQPGGAAPAVAPAYVPSVSNARPASQERQAVVPPARRAEPAGRPYEPSAVTAQPPTPRPDMPPPVTPSPPRPTAGSAADSGQLQRIAASWERIRTEVKAVDRKVEALLASTDPGMVLGDALFVIAAYPFHVSKLNDARVRGIVEDAVERVGGTRLNASFVLRDELPSATAGAAPATGPDPASQWNRPAPVSPASPPPMPPTNGVHEDEPPFDDEFPPPVDDEFTRNVKTILNAEEVVDPDEIARIP